MLPSNVVFESLNVGRFIAAKLALALVNSLKVSQQNRCMMGGKGARSARGRGSPVLSRVLLYGLDRLGLELALLAGQANVNVVVVLLGVIHHNPLAFFAHKFAQVALYRLWRPFLFLSRLYRIRRGTLCLVDVEGGRVWVILSAKLAHVLVGNPVSVSLVLDDVHPRRGLEVALVALGNDNRLVRLLVICHHRMPDGDEIAEVAFVGANLAVLLEDVVDDVLPVFGLEAAEVAVPRAFAGNSAMAILLVAVQRAGKLGIKINF